VGTEKTESTFSLSYRVALDVRAAPAVVFARLTDAKGFPTWNSTVTSIDGDIAVGNQLTIRVPISPDRAFTPKVVELAAPQRMVWQDGFAPVFRGRRTFDVTPTSEGGCTFVMEEVFTGLMLPMIKGSLPDFRPVFDRYAADLKAACEAVTAPG
jgi:uncharacterized protein YndB with AHSA1/START domain